MTGEYGSVTAADIRREALLLDRNFTVINPAFMGGVLKGFRKGDGTWQK